MKQKNQKLLLNQVLAGMLYNIWEFLNRCWVLNLNWTRFVLDGYVYPFSPVAEIN